MPRKKPVTETATKPATEVDGVEDELNTESVPIASSAEWLATVMELVCNDDRPCNKLRRALPPEDYEIMAAPYHAEGLDPEEAADEIRLQLDAARSWLLELCAFQAFCQNWRANTALEMQGSMPPGWLVDMMRQSIRAARDDGLFFIKCILMGEFNLPIALPAGPYRAWFEARRDEICDKFESGFKKM